MAGAETLRIDVLGPLEASRGGQPVEQAMGDNATAHALMRAALEIFRDIGTPEAGQVGALLTGTR